MSWKYLNDSNIKEDIDKKYFIDGDVLQCLNAWEEMIQIFPEGEKISPVIMINEHYNNHTQEDFDNSDGTSNNDFVFDELGLFSLDPSTGNEIVGDATASATHTDFASKCYMLTHVIFHPVQKSLNRIIEVVYTLRIQMS